jgi:dephospho-CoA kinase
VLDIPLLFEGAKRGTGAAVATKYDATILVWVPVETQIERTTQRDGCDRGEAERRIEAQLPIDEKREMANFVIDNSRSREETASQVRELYAKLTEEEVP